MKFFLQDSNSEQIDSILKSLNKLMDGDVSHQMKQKGLEYKLNYGASILWLRQLSNKFKGNNELANRLWLREIRETMILATLIIDPQKDTTNVIQEWLENIPTNEMAEQLGTNTLWKLDHINSTCNKMLQSNDNFQKAAAWVAFATFLQRGKQLTDLEIEQLINQITSDLQNNSPFMLRVKGRFLRQLCRYSETYLNKVENMIDELESNHIAPWLTEDVKTEITFLKEK
ncbi:DNA alkylation repair protein [Plebeiibacterium sediminum]|uniref:DNA alkylation repair protein n=1 Tax=Plebeiibacterium sediminum TaxID=2992112 RepID=A0AAE3SDL1_9BACT|nr:DNA alkylation repair protein [Plebeiobacterium sediminum]MCW3784952.1 DNA alkylation repair protein [Plebeiobacterium sediminum]